MPGATRKGDLTVGHVWLPTPAIEGSPDVIVNGLPVVRVGDHYATHSLPFPPTSPHDSVSAQGSKTVFANGKAVTRVGDQTSCSDTVLLGSEDVIVGD